MYERCTPSTGCGLKQQLKLPVPHLHQQHHVLLLHGPKHLERLVHSFLPSPARPIPLLSLLGYDLHGYRFLRRSWREERGFESGGEGVGEEVRVACGGGGGLGGGEQVGERGKGAR